MKKWVLKTRHWSHYYLNRLFGQAESRPDFDLLSQEQRFNALKAQFIHLFEDYTPYEWEPLHSFYGQLGFSLPSGDFMKRQAAMLSAEFVLIVESMHRHHLPPDFLKSLFPAEEIEFYQQLCQRYLASIESDERWSLGFFYSSASHVLKKKHSMACAELESKPVVLQPEKVMIGLQAEVA